jgi:hypothetical protein
MSPTIIDMYYERDASENVMNRLFNPRTGKITRGLRKNARFWRDHLIREVEKYKDQYGDDVVLTIQVLSDGSVRGDSQNFVKLACDAVAKGLGLAGDHRFAVFVLPRTTIKTLERPHIQIKLQNPGEEQADDMPELQ